MTLRSPLTWLLIAAVVAVVAAGVVGQQRSARRAELVELERTVGAIPLNTEAPKVDFIALDGRRVSLESYRGRHVFVNFWATWCGPCKMEEPSLLALHAALDPADIAFVSVAEDDADPPLQAYLARNPLPFDVYRDRPPRVEVPFATTAYPTSFLIDPEGVAVYRFNSARDWNTPEVKRLFELQGIGLR